MARIALYAKLDVNFFDHPKVHPLPGPAKLLYVQALAFTKRFGTNGLVVAVQLPRLVESADDPEALVAALVAAELWTVVEDGWQIANWAESNLTTTEVEARRRSETMRKRMSRNVSDGTSTGVPSDTPADTSHVSDRTPKTVPSLSEVKLSEVKTSEEKTRSPRPPARNVDGLDFEGWWECYPKQVQRRAAEKAYGEARSRGMPIDVLVGTKRWAKYWAQTGTALQFVPNPAKFLETDQWIDPPPPTEAEQRIARLEAKVQPVRAQPSDARIPPVLPPRSHERAP